MTTSKAVSVSRTFKASPEKVFAAFEDPETLARWMVTNQSNTEVQALDVRVGGPISVTMSWEGGMSIRLFGTFKRVEKPHVLEFTWTMESDGNEGLVTLEFEPSGAGTELTVTHEGLAVEARAYAEAGWNGWFDGLEEVLAD